VNKFLTLLLAIVFVAGGAFSQNEEAPYRLGAGDQIRITVFGEEDLSGNFEIDGGGMVSLPLIGSVAIGGKNISMAQSAVAVLLADGYLISPRVNIEVLNYRPFYIIGEVNQPGSYPYVSGMTVLKAIALGSGFTYRANEKKFELTRKVDGKDVKITAKLDTIVRPGDIIRVDERFF